MAKTKSAFTLIELLIVIAIIAILAAIVIPLFAAAKERAINIKCLNNEKQLALAFRHYMDDNNGRMPRVRPRYTDADPPPMDWCGAVYPKKCVISNGSLWTYTKNRAIYLCSADRGLRAEGINGKPKDYPLSYSANAEAGYANLDNTPNCRQSRMLLLIHESRDTINDGFLYWRNAHDDMPSRVHYEGSNVCFADGHVSYLKYDQLMKRRASGEWDPDPHGDAP